MSLAGTQRERERERERERAQQSTAHDTAQHTPQHTHTHTHTHTHNDVTFSSRHDHERLWLQSIGKVIAMSKNEAEQNEPEQIEIMPAQSTLTRRTKDRSGWRPDSRGAEESEGRRKPGQRAVSEGYRKVRISFKNLIGALDIKCSVSEVWSNAQ